jgi:hypothetical protein
MNGGGANSCRFEEMHFPRFIQGMTQYLKDTSQQLLTATVILHDPHSLIPLPSKVNMTDVNLQWWYKVFAVGSGWRFFVLLKYTFHVSC